MAIKSIYTELASKVALATTITKNGSSLGIAIDTKDYSTGINFNFALISRADGDYVFKIKQSDNADMSSSSYLADYNFVGSQDNLHISISSHNGDVFNGVGVVGAKRYLQVECVATEVSSGSIAFSTFTGASDISPDESLKYPNQS